MRLYKATQADDEQLKAFIEGLPIPGIYDYRIVRPHSFFDQYKLTTDDYQTYVLKDNQQQIHAMASILFRKAYVNAQEQTIGYVTDLRVSANRKATLSWGKEFIPIMEEECKKRNCQYVFSDLEQYENKAYNTLLRRPHRQLKMPRYHLFRKFHLIIIYGKRLFQKPPPAAIQIEHAQSKDIERICRYLQEKDIRRPLRYHLTAEELERRCREWPLFSIENFLLATNSHGKLIGVMAPWNNREVQQVIAHKYHLKSFQVFSTNQLLSMLQLARPFPRPGQEFRVKHITHGAYDNPDIFYALLNKAYQECENKELLAYPNHFGDYATRPPQAFTHTKIPYGFYTLLENEKSLPTYLHPNPFSPAPDFQYSHF